MLHNSCMINVKAIRKDFPIFSHHPGLVYLDSAATSLKPQSVIDAQNKYLSQHSTNVKRGLYPLSEKTTKAVEQSRSKTASFIGGKPDEIIFTKNTTESLNLLAYVLEDKIFAKDSEIVTTIMEHHSNFVPWQQVAQREDAKFKIMKIDSEGKLNLDDLRKAVTKKTKIFALTYASNAIGTINDLKKIAQIVRKNNKDCLIIVDGAQGVPHLGIDISELDIDFLAFSAHKMLGPTGLGILWGKKTLLNELKPFMFGGEMIKTVKEDKSTFAETPHKFEAGTPPIGEIISFKESLDYIEQIGYKSIRNHELNLIKYITQQLNKSFQSKVTILGPQKAEERCGLLSFTINNIHPHDIGELLGKDNICIRAGHHCTMPLHNHLGIAASTRVSFNVYNDKDDIDQVILVLKEVIELFDK